MTPTVTTAGTTINTVPERASVHIDARAWTRAELERVDQELRQLRPAQPEADLTLHGHIDRLPFQPHSAQLLLAAAEAAARDVGLPPLRANRSGVASDANITAAIGIPTLDGLGAIGAHPHARSERADVTSMPTRAAFLAATLQRAVKLGN